MEQRIEKISKKIFVGKSMTMSFAENKTAELWKSFMPLRKSIPHSVGTTLYSLQIYPSNFFNPFKPTAAFTKWALIEVRDFSNVAEGMTTFTLEEGLYSVFVHKGPASTGHISFQYIFNTWLPHSAYELDNRPHFEVLGENYKHDAQDSEEELWIPIKPKFNQI
jgi:AraC family transcriptional regulator